MRFNHLTFLALVLAPAGVLRLASQQALAHQGHQSQGAQALYATKAEAEAAAKRFHCTGTHPMGDKWMPCAMPGSSGGH